MLQGFLDSLERPEDGVVSWGSGKSCKTIIGKQMLLNHGYSNNHWYCKLVISVPHFNDHGKVEVSVNHGKFLELVIVTLDFTLGRNCSLQACHAQFWSSDRSKSQVCCWDTPEKCFISAPWADPLRPTGRSFERHLPIVCSAEELRPPLKQGGQLTQVILDMENWWFNQQTWSSHRDVTGVGRDWDNWSRDMETWWFRDKQVGGPHDSP